MITELTREQEAQIPVIRDKWIDLFFKNVGKPIDKEKTEKSFTEAYKAAGYNKPRFVYCTSPRDAQNKVNQDLGRENNPKFESFSDYGGVSGFGWLAYADYWQNVVNIEFDEKTAHAAKCLTQLAESLVYDTIQYDQACYIVPYPSSLSRDAEGRLHSTTGPAIEWADGFKLYFVAGREIPSHIFEEDVTAEKFLSEKNTENRMAMYARIGEEGFLSLFDAEVIDSATLKHRNGDIENLELLETKEEFLGNKMKFLRMVCPSTFATYVKCCPPNVTKAIQAQAALSNIFDEIDIASGFDART